MSYVDAPVVPREYSIGPSLVVLNVMRNDDCVRRIDDFWQCMRYLPAFPFELSKLNP